jgi:hypothetical protein
MFITYMGNLLTTCFGQNGSLSGNAYIKCTKKNYCITSYLNLNQSHFTIGHFILKVIRVYIDVCYIADFVNKKVFL